MQIRRRRLITSLLAVLPVTACQLDSRKQAVNDIVDFALSSPFTMMDDGGAARHLAIADTALDDFNRIFDYLPKSDDVDSARYYYNRWIERFLDDASFSSVEDLSFSLEADTLVASVAVRRPELQGFSQTILSRLETLDSSDLASRIERAKRELQIRDTLVLRVVAGPRVVAWSSAIRQRDSMRLATSSPVLALAMEDPREMVPPKAVTALRDVEVLQLVDPADSTLNLWITTNANVREGPGMEHDVLTSRPPGTQLVADSLVDGWYHVGLGKGVEGFISGTLVSVDSVAVAQPEPESRPASQSKAARTET